MFDKIKQIKNETGKNSFRKTVQELTDRNIPTPNGGEWSISTLQHLEKRWIALGLMPEKPKAKSPQQ